MRYHYNILSDIHVMDVFTMNDCIFEMSSQPQGEPHEKFDLFIWSGFMYGYSLIIENIYSESSIQAFFNESFI